MIQNLWFKLDYKCNFFFSNTYIGISNLIYYFKVIWNDRDFDYGFIETLLLAKLKKQQSFFLQYSKEIDYPLTLNKELEEITLAIRLLERLQSDYYAFEYPLNICNNFTLPEKFYLNNSNLIKKELLKDPDFLSGSERVIAFKIGYEKTEKAKRLLYRILSEKGSSWWI